MKFKLKPNKKYSNILLMEHYDDLGKWYATSTEAANFLQSLTIRELLQLIENPTIPDYKAQKKIHYISKVKQALEKFERYLEMTTYHDPKIPKAPLEQTFEEAILLTMKEFYGITSLEEITQRSVAEFLIARKDIYNRLIIQDRIIKSANKK